MTGIEAKTFDKPDEVRDFSGKGNGAIVNVGGVAVAKGTFLPGWRWSEHVKPIVQTDWCEATHLGYLISGRMGVHMKDGTEAEAGPGAVVAIEPGHDAWVVGNEPCVMVDFGPSVAQYAKR